MAASLAYQRPQIDRAFYRPSHGMAALYIATAISLFVIPGYASYLIAVSQISLAIKVLAMLPLTILSAYGLNMLGFVGHEGMHGSLLRNRTASALVGLFSASAVLTYFEMGFAMSHWNHHRFTNQADDPDVGPVRRLRTWWQRLLFSRAIYNWLYFRHTLGMALGKPIPFKYKMAYPFRHQVWFARLNFLFAMLWLLLYLAIASWNWQLAVFAIGAPLVTVMFIAAIQIYLDHAGLGDRLFENARSRTSWAMTVLFFGANYHLEHHAYPGVPCYRLPKLYRYLQSIRAYDAVPTSHDPRFFGVFASVALPYAEGKDRIDFDAFEPATTDSPLDAVASRPRKMVSSAT